MRGACNYIILGGLAFVLAGCAVPYYAAPPAPVYYPVQPAEIYYPAQGANISSLPPHAAVSSDPEQARAADVPRERHAVAEQRQARADHRHGTDKAEVWINPKPLNGSWYETSWAHRRLIA
jgi:hypothetical protein